MNLQCPQCKIVNAPDAKFCKGCGIAFAVAPIKKKNSLIQAAAIIVGLLIIFGICAGALSKIDTAPKTASPAISTPELDTSPPIKLLSARGEIDDDYVTVTGEVANISNEKLERVWVVITHYGANGDLITSDDAILDYDPLMPGQTSPFKAMVRRNPLMKTYKIGFKHTFGETIDFIDARTIKTPPPKKKK